MGVDRDRLKEQLGQQGMTWRLGFDRQPSDATWSIPAEFELRADEAGEPVIWWDQRRGRLSPETIDRYGSSLGMTEAEDDGELFSRFLELGRDFDDSGRGITPVQSQRALGFAQRYGAMVLCSDHSQPVMHCPGEHRAGAKTGRLPSVRELMDLSHQLRTVLKVAVQLEKDEAPSWKDCLTILRVQNPDIVKSDEPYETGRQDLKAAVARDEGHAEWWLSLAVNQWIRHGELRPHLEWTAGGPKRVELNVRSLLGSLARQVFVTVTGEVGLAICDGCSQLFVPENRKPKAGQLTWCYDCGEGSNYRVAKRVSARMRRRE